MKKVLLRCAGVYIGMTVSSFIMWLLSLYKLEKRIDRDIEFEEIESLVLDDPVIQYLANIDNCILRTMASLLCIPYVTITCSNTVDKIKF